MQRGGEAHLLSKTTLHVSDLYPLQGQLGKRVECGACEVLKNMTSLS